MKVRAWLLAKLRALTIPVSETWFNEQPDLPKYHGIIYRDYLGYTYTIKCLWPSVIINVKPLECSVAHGWAENWRQASHDMRTKMQIVAYEIEMGKREFAEVEPVHFEKNELHSALKHPLTTWLCGEKVF